VDSRRAAELIATAGTNRNEWLAPDATVRLLACYGVSTCPQRVVVGADAAVSAAADLGYPIVAKLAAAGVHKTDVGGVRLDIEDQAALRKAVSELSVGRDDGAALVLQPMIPAGLEIIVGALQHDQFGPTVMVGAGGVLTDLVADRTFRLAPVSGQDAKDMLDELRTGRLLDGYRGHPAISRPALEDLVVRIGQLITDLPQIAELDLNPVICRDEQLVVVDARIRVAPPEVRTNSLSRHLS
jgi:acyl-CoA synthetase (NDP forming)